MSVKGAQSMSTAAKTLCVACIIALLGASLDAQEFENPKAGRPPRAKPARQSGGESVPPLPLPATPLRRSEKKRQPSEPALVGMINFSQMVASVSDGKRVEQPAFPTTAIDIERLVRFANDRLKVRYRHMGLTLERFSYDPQELPILYLTGWKPMPNLNDAIIDRLRRYLYDGGTLVIHAQCGRPEFVSSARVQIARILPNRRLAPLDTDSPLFNAFAPIKEMRFREDDKPFRTMPPYLEAVFLGCRPAIIFSPIDLNCGWDVVNNPIQGGLLYHQDDALALGLNIITATLANFQYARQWGSQKVFVEAQEASRDRLVIAQVVHDGDWDPTPHALPNLMKLIQSQTTLNVQFKREVVNLGDVDVFKNPVLYMTGLRDFKLSEGDAERLRKYLTSGGVLIADAAAGSRSFDVAFRREFHRVLGEELTVLDPTSEVFQTPHRISGVHYTPLVQAKNQINAPLLEGAIIDGHLAIIYSPLSLSNGWEQLGFAYNRGYSDGDALRLGVNIFAYALMH